MGAQMWAQALVGPGWSEQVELPRPRPDDLGPGEEYAERDIVLAPWKLEPAQRA